MAGNIGHKVVVDINLTSVNDVKDEEDGEEEMSDEDDIETDDEEVMSDNQEDPLEEIDMSSIKSKQKGRKVSKVKLADRPVRERKQKQQFHCSSFGWSYDEKRKLLKALKKHPPSAIDLLQAEVSSKTKLQIKDFMNKINKAIHWKSDNPIPVVDWINMARDLLRTEKKDYTDSLPRAMSIISSFDNHPKPAERTPDYSAIYQYLALVLEGKELPLLGPLESAVMLDLLYGVADKIAMSDTTRQRQVMRWKYKLLSSKVDTQNNQLFIRQARKALSNDFEEFENASNATVASGSSTQTSQTPSSSQQRSTVQTGTQSSSQQRSTVQTGTPSSSQQRSTGQTSTPSSKQQRPTVQPGTPSSKQQRSTVPADTNTATMSGSAPGQSTTSTAISRSTRVVNETTVISHNSDKSANPVPTAKKQLGPPKKRHKNSEVEFSIRRETDIIVSKNLLISDNETAEGVGNNSLKVKEKGRIQEGVRAGRHKAGADSDSIQVLGDEDESPPVKRRRGDADEIESHPMPDSYVVRKEILDSEQLNKQTDPEQMLSQNVRQRETASTVGNSLSSTDESRPLESTQNQTQSPPSVKKKKAVGRPRKSVYKKKEDPVRSDSVVPNQVFWRGPGRPAGAKKIIPERPEKVLEDPSEIPKKPSLYTLNPLCVPVSLLSLRNKPGCTSAQPVVRKKSFPAIISKKHSPLFNCQKNEGITSVSIHRMAAVIPVSKQHILLPNSATQKSQS